MNVRALEINESLQLVPVDVDQAVSAAGNKDARIWFDIPYEDDSDLEKWSKKFDVSGLAQRICLEMGDRSGFYPLNREIVFSIPVPLERLNCDDVRYVTWVCRENLLLTVCREDAAVERWKYLLDDTTAWIPNRNIAAIVSGALVSLSLDGLQQTADLRHSLRALEERVDRRPDQVEADEILDARSSLLPLAEIVSDWLPVVQSLSSTDRLPFRDHDIRDRLNCAVANLKAANAQLNRMDDRIDALHAGFQMHAQEKTNRRLGVLTILSAVFMPITLLAGIWGMNFDRMPELRFAYSYPIALVSMGVIALSMYLFFRAKGWFE